MSARLPRTVIVVFAAAQFLAGLDMSIMNVALPAIQQQFDAGMMAVQWSVMAEQKSSEFGPTFLGRRDELGKMMKPFDND